MKVQRDGRDFTVEVTADGEGLVSHAGSALLAQVADKTGLTQALSAGLEGMPERRSGHDPGRVVCDLAVMLADGGDCLADLGAVRDQAPLFGAVASGSGRRFGSSTGSRLTLACWRRCVTHVRVRVRGRGSSVLSPHA